MKRLVLGVVSTVVCLTAAALPNDARRAECAALVLRAANYITEHPSIPPEPVDPDVPDPVAPPEWIFGDEIPIYEADPSTNETIEEPIEEASQDEDE